MPYDPDSTPSPLPEDANSARTPARRDPYPLTWPRALAHGLNSAFVLVLVLTLFAGLLGEVPFALLFFAGLVLPPALTARHFARRPLPEPPPGSRTAPEVLDYARAIQSLDYQPGPGSTDDDLADYLLALDVYDRTRTAEPGDLDSILAEGWAALTRLRTPNAEWNHGEGDTVLRLPRPEPGTMAVLALTSPALGLVRVRARGGRGPWARLYEAGGPVCARLPLPAREGDSVQLELRLEGAWRLAVLGSHVIRGLTAAAPRLSGHGGDVLALEAPTTRLTFQHGGHGPYQLRRLTPTLRPAEILAEGVGEARLTLPAPAGHLQIQTRGGWTLDSGEAAGEREPGPEDGYGPPGAE
ncbi:cell wall protein [Streptomyces sp. SPB074]|uniref:cell wall protein n=1 Tax=Streptomyces sp. (strain SPB074) TaxID=465543 RepID=UPI00017F1D57|nr:cell wall protein [Streptomyces sp. SPB074]